MTLIDNVEAKKFVRSLELLNKTNQFNTTGRRWSEQEMGQYFAEGGRMLAADVSDRLSDYGLTAVLLYRDRECTQFVMSCRVFGLHIESVVFNEFLSIERGEHTVLLCDTGKNSLCRKFMDKVGLSFPTDEMYREAVSISIPLTFEMAYSLIKDVKITRAGNNVESSVVNVMDRIQVAGGSTT